VRCALGKTAHVLARVGQYYSVKLLSVLCILQDAESGPQIHHIQAALMEVLDWLLCAIHLNMEPPYKLRQPIVNISDQCTRPTIRPQTYHT
jgi:hypothetical protein